MILAPSLAATFAAKAALAEFAHLGVHTVAAYHAAAPYLIAYADHVAGDPWTVAAVVHGFAVYLHRTGSIPGPRPGPEPTK